jgi:hypothetical protein
VVLRSVLGSSSFEIEAEDVRTRWTEWTFGQSLSTLPVQPELLYPMAEEQLQGGPSASATYRLSLPTRDGHAALCLVAYVNEANLGYWYHGSTSSTLDATGYREAALGAAFAIPVPIAGRLNSAFAFEYRRIRFTKWGDDSQYSKRSPAWGHELVINAGAALADGWTLSFQARTSMFGERFGYPPTWRVQGVPVLRLGVLRHFDGT